MSEQAPEPGFDKLAAALAAFQAVMPTVPKAHTATVKSERGASYAYTYAGLADVTEAAMPLLAAHGLSFVTLPRDGLLTGMLLHSSGQCLTASLPITGSTPQQIGSSLTYMRRYLLGCMTGLVTDDDEDGQLASQGTARKPRKETPRASERPLSAVPADAQRPPIAPDLPPDDESPYLDVRGGLAAAMFAALGDIGKHEKPDRLDYVIQVIGHPITTSGEMTDREAEAVIASARSDLQHERQP